MEIPGAVIHNPAVVKYPDEDYEKINGEHVMEMKELDKKQNNNEDEADYMIIRKQLKYPVDKQPSWPIAFLLGFQQYLIMFGPTFAIPVILAPSLCIKSNHAALGELLNTMFVMCGITTMLQVFLGTRLPIIQSGSYVFFAVASGILSKNGKCQDTYTMLDDSGENVTVTWDPNWKKGMRELQGNLMLASCLQIILGGLGLVGFLLKVIGPITIAVLVSLIGLCLTDVAAFSASQHWGISLGMVILVTIFSEYLKDVQVPIPVLSFKQGVCCRIVWLKVFSTLSIILSLAIMWGLCGILTATNVFKEGNHARVTNLTQKLSEANWIYVPYPGQFGTPTISIGGFVGMFAGVLAGIIESIGDYYACAKLSGAPPPPKYALNRGILMEGIGCLLTGAVGPGVGVTSYSENIGAISLTKVGSRRVIFCSAIMMSVIGLLGKIGVLFASIPEPIIGGMYLVMFGIIASVGISNLQFVDLTSSRNVFIIGISLYLGIVIPDWTYHNQDRCKTGIEELDQLIIVILTSGMIVGGGLACFLDNTIAGTDEERGMTNYKAATKQCKNKKLIEAVYHIPGTEFLCQKIPLLRKLPFVQK